MAVVKKATTTAKKTGGGGSNPGNAIVPAAPKPVQTSLRAANTAPVYQDPAQRNQRAAQPVSKPVGMGGYAQASNPIKAPAYIPGFTPLAGIATAIGSAARNAMQPIMQRAYGASPANPTPAGVNNPSYPNAATMLRASLGSSVPNFQPMATPKPAAVPVYGPTQRQPMRSMNDEIIALGGQQIGTSGVTPLQRTAQQQAEQWAALHPEGNLIALPADYGYGDGGGGGGGGYGGYGGRGGYGGYGGGGDGSGYNGPYPALMSWRF